MADSRYGQQQLVDSKIKMAATESEFKQITAPVRLE